jgi:hypothetical protein
MTLRTPPPDGSAALPSGGGLAAEIAPEAVAGVLSIVVVVALLTARLAFAGAGTTTPSPSPTAVPTAVPTASPPSVDSVAIRTLLQVDRYVLSWGKDIEGELKSPPVDTRNVQYLMTQIRIQLFQGKLAAQRLAATQAGAAVGTELGAVYAALTLTIDQANPVSLQVEKRWRESATAVVATLARIPALDEQLELLLAGGPGPSASIPPSIGPSSPPSPSVSPSATAVPATPTPPPTLPPTPTATPPPTLGPTPSPGPNPLVNPGFEAGVGSPWELVRSDTAAAATVSTDSASRHGGSFSARIDIAVPSNKRAGISLQQGGLSVEAGGIYRVSLWARSTTTRDIQIRITTAGGQTLGDGTNLFTIGPDWAPLAFDFSSFLGSDSAVFAIEVGLGGDPVWVDDTSIVRIPPSTP